MLPFQKEQEYY